MLRRNFLQALMAAAAGLTVAGRPASAKPPLVTVAADTSRFESGISETQRVLAEMLKECRVTSWSRNTLVSGSETWTITYYHAPGTSLTSLDEEAAQATKGRAPRSVWVSTITSSIDASELSGLGRYSLAPTPDKAGYEIEVEWA